MAHMPTLRRERLAAAFLYFDAQADDARLTLTILKTAVDHGAVVANYSPVVALLKDGEGGRASGAVLADGTQVRASVVVNAAGVWADDVRALDEGAHPHTLRPAKGIHVTVPWDKVRCDVAAVVPVPKDRRSIFVVPWGDRVYLGTTDTDYEGPLEDPQCTPEDVAYILGAINGSITSTIGPEDVLGTWAGLRPLVASASSERTADLSRRHAVRVSDTGVVTVTGGKLTTYRKMAADTVDAVLPLVGRSKLRRSPTKKLRLHGADGHERVTDAHLAGRFGADARVVQAMVAASPSLAEPLVPGLPYLKAEAVYAARYEMAHTVEDVLSRRTRALLLGRDAAIAAAPSVAALLAPELGWDEAEQARQVASFVERATAERDAAGLPVAGVRA
jgi:glycerol-3-phosphate dehydrogenase